MKSSDLLRLRTKCPSGEESCRIGRNLPPCCPPYPPSCKSCLHHPVHVEPLFQFQHYGTMPHMNSPFQLSNYGVTPYR